MNIDSSVLYAVSEIKNELPARIQKIYQHIMITFITGQIIIKIGY